MGIVRTQVEFDHDSGLSRDRIVNTFHHITPNQLPSEQDLDDITDRLIAGYTVAQAPGLIALDEFFSPVFAGTWRLKHYDVDAADHTPPIRVDTGPALNLQAANGLPGEVALVLSYDLFPRVQAVPIGRQRGRIYLGPFITDAIGSNGRPSQPVIDAVVGLGGLLMSFWNGSPAWGVYSRSQDEVPGAEDFFVATRVRCDNEWDTQRRRGMRPTAYTTLTAAVQTVLACSLDQWSTSGVSLATGLTGCLVLLIRTLRARVIDDEQPAKQNGSKNGG